MPLETNGERLWQRLHTLATFGAREDGGVCRLAFSDADRLGRDWLCQHMRELGLQVHIDPIGNLFGVLAGAQPARPPVMTGSHLDSVITGGRFDGSLGVLAGLEVVEALRETGHTPDTSLVIAAFSNEEGARYAPDMLGSLVYCDDLPLSEALATRGIDGSLLGDELDAIGYAGPPLPDWLQQPSAFIELHIEQGPILEQQQRDIGIVEGVQGIHWLALRFCGQSNHAGTTPMALRRDPGLVACQMASELRQLTARDKGLRATCGRLQLTPNLVNVVPAQAEMTIDLRHRDGEALVSTAMAVRRMAQALAVAEGVELNFEVLADFAPQPFDLTLIDAIEHHSTQRGYKALRLYSGAGHDAQIMARRCPSAMIFVPSQHGVSHNIDEYTAPEHIHQGTQLLADVLLERLSA